MAAGDKYFNCDNQNITLDQIFRKLIVQDENGNPALRTYNSGSNSSEVEQRSGNHLLFDTDSIYNTIASPGNGNITVDFSDAALGATVFMIHESASEPTYPISFQRLESSGIYSPNEINYYFFLYIGTSKVLYRIDKNI